MAATHGAPQRAPLLTPTEARLIEAGMARGPRIIALALADGEAATLAAETRAAIREHRRECDDVKWSDVDREHVQPLEGRLTAHLVPVQTFGRAAVRSPYATPPRERPFWRAATALVVIAGAVLVIGGTELLRAAWAAWGGAR